MKYERDTVLKIIYNCNGASASYDHFKYPFEIIPENYLEFAKADLNIGDKRSLVNAYSNVKRGIECQVDSLLSLLGFYKQSKKENWNPPKKIDFIGKVKIVNPNILKKINKVRNLIEHEYKLPIKDHVEDVVDILELFLHATEKYLREIDDFDIDVSEYDEYIRYTKEGVLCDWNINFEYDKIKKEFVVFHATKELFRITELDKEFWNLMHKYIEFIKTL